MYVGSTGASCESTCLQLSTRNAIIIADMCVCVCVSCAMHLMQIHSTKIAAALPKADCSCYEKTIETE